ncbi:hypothetical protein EDB83DRAFT_1291712 [Lactarius deliciosus]|nr:hypothetical protein EDB83DRAFT_1291712 [Lactarius deliciosus]
MEDIEAQVHSVTGDQPASTIVNPQGPQRPHPAVVADAQPTATTVNPQTRNPTPPNTADVQPQATSANGRPHGDAPPSPIAGNPDPQQGEKFGDSSDGLWSMYLTEAEKQDKDVTESWKGDAEGILVFTGLFSATVAAFIIESYQNLSPKSGDTTNALLTQISQQLVNISNGTPLTSVATQISHPFKPTASAVRVNVLWFLSLVLSVTCALSATLMQQWARRYQELAQHHGAPHKRGRMRAYIFDGISRFGMARAVATMPKLLHISVFLFFAGLIDFLFPIDTTVSYLTLGLVVAFTLAYAVLTVLPNLYLDCPYATPLSGFTWRLSQFSVIVGLKAALGIEDLFHNSLLSDQVDQHVTRPRVERWREALENQVKVHRQWLSDGLRRTVERNAKDTPPTAVTNALEWTLTGLDEDKEIETFAAGVPGFFDSRTVPNATSAILPLMTEKTPTDAILGSRLYDLLKTCMPGTSPLNDEERKSRLRLCLKSLWYFGRAYNQFSEPLPSYFPRTLASPEIIRLIQTEQDPVSRVMGRCFGALVVVKLAADVRSRTGSSVQINHEELACLSAILDAESRDVIFCLKWPGAVELASMISLALGGVGSSGINALPSDVLDAAQQTLTILSQTAEQLLDQPVAQLNISDGKFDRIIISRLHSLLEMCISGTPPLSAEVRRSCLRICLKNLCYFGRAYNQPLAPEPLPSYLIRTLTSPEIIRRIRTEQDPISRVMGRCFCTLVVVKLAGGVRLRADSNVQSIDEELACLSAILGTKSDDVRLCLKWSGAVELASMVSLTFGDVDTWAVNTLPSDVHDVAQQTLAILSQVLPAEETTGLRLDLPITGLDISDGKFGRIIVSHLFNLLEVYILGTSPLTTEVRRSCLRLCLKSLWYFGREYNQPWASEPLPSYFPRTLSSPEFSRLIQTEQDPVSRVMVCCFGALVVKKLVAGIKSSNLKAQISDKELACLSAILGTESDDVKLWLRQPGSIELVNTLFLAFGDIGSLSADTVPSYVLDVVPQTFSILSQVLPAEINTKPRPDQKHALANIPDVPIKGEIHQGHSIRVSQGPVALCTSVQSARQLGAPAALYSHCFRKPSYVSSHTHGTRRLYSCDWTLRRSIGRKEACSWRRIKHRLKCSNRRRGASVPISYSWHQTR